MDRKKALLLLGGLIALLVVIGINVGPIAQPLHYHDFADQRGLLGVPNGMDVWSNMPFALVGFWGLFLLLSPSRVQFVDNGERWPWIGVSLGLILTAIGSAYYHLVPDNARLVWDRLPMTLVFMSYVAALITERIDKTLGLWLWPVLLAVGIYSVFQWQQTELSGGSDLRFYGGMQVFTVLATLIFLFIPSRYTHNWDLALVILFFGAARIFELYDHEVWMATGGIISGHTLKHLVAAFAGFWLLRMLAVRRIANAH